MNKLLHTIQRILRPLLRPGTRPLLALASTLAFATPWPASSAAPESFARSHVVIAYHPHATSAFLPMRDPVKVLLQDGLTRLTRKDTPTQAWLSLLSTQDVVGIKVYTNPGPNIGTRKEVTAAVVEGLLEAGFPPSRIVVWDKSLASLRESGHLDLADQYGIRVASSQAAGYDPTVFYENPLIGNLIYSDLEFGRKGEGIGRKSHVSLLLTRDITKLICISPLLNHNSAGVCGNLYSLASGSVDNIFRFESTPQRLAESIPEICAMPELSDRVVLNIVDALICQYQGEQRGLLHYSTALNELRLSQDPVALDVLSIQELDRQRKASNMKASPDNTALFDNAALLQIGKSKPHEILIQRVISPLPPND